MASLLSQPIWQRRRTVCVTAIVLAAVADYLFYEHVIGWTLGLFGAAMLACVLARSRGSRLWKSWQGWVAVPLVMALLLSLVKQPSTAGVLMVLLGIVTVALLTRQKLSGRVAEWVSMILVLLMLLFVRPVMDWATAARWGKRRPRTRPGFMKVATSVAWWVFPILAGGIFFLLFAIANPIIESWLHTAVVKLATIYDWLPQYLGPGRFLLWFCVALAAYGILRYRPPQGATTSVAMMPVAAIQREATWFNGPQMIVRCLLVFNAVFGLETVLDIVYLFGGRTLPAGMDYRDYAHRGAYPLIFTALVAGMFVLWAFRIGGPAHRSAWSRRLVYLWLLQNVFLLFSTFWRIWLYVEACLLTRLRVAALIWVTLVALGFVWIILKIVASRSNGWLWMANALTLAGVLVVCAFINFDGMIAEFDVSHCAAYTHTPGPEIELPYLVGLGPDALPALVRLRQEDRNAGDQQFLDDAIPKLRLELTEDLADWRGWTWRRGQIARVVKQ